MTKVMDGISLPTNVGAFSAHISQPAKAHAIYRPDIDGLRAIAVLSVVVFHAFPTLIPGGFIGVDIFFVISGYLISSIILSKLERGTFSLLEFYDRRIRRIFPALSVVMIICLIVGYYLLLATEYQQLAKHVASGATYIANFVFWRDSGYFDASADTKPMLHLWSLAVEEQFYIFWPLVLGLLWKWKRHFFPITFAIAATSFALNLFLSDFRPSAAFYLPLPRFWELLIGAVLAYLAARDRVFLPAYKNMHGILGCGLIAVGLFAINSTSAFPGWWALLPTTGAFLIIAAGADGWINRKLLANKHVVWIGLISYPLYLWHWPIFAFLRISTEAQPAWELMATAILVAVILAWITYAVIEKQIRFSQSKWTSIMLCTVMAGVLGYCGLVAEKNGLPGRDADIELDYLTSQDIFEGSRNANTSCFKHLNKVAIPEEICLANSSTPKTLFVGDSHAMALHSAIYSNTFRAATVLLAAHSCPLYPDVEITPVVKKAWGRNCTAIANEILKLVAETPSITTVVMNNLYIPKDLKTDFTYRMNKESISVETAFLEGNGRLIKALQELGKKVVFIVDVPHLKLAPTECLQRLSFLSANECRYTEQEHIGIRESYLKLVARLAENNPALHIFDTTSLFCFDGYCQKQNAGKYLYNDTHHLSLSGSHQVLTELRHGGYLGD